MPNMADLKMIADANPFQRARIKHTLSKRGHVGFLECRMHIGEALIERHGPFTIYVVDESRVRWRRCSIKPQDIDGRLPIQLELLGYKRRYVELKDWVVQEEGVNLRELAWMMVDLEEGYTAEFAPSPENHRAAYDEKEDWLREHFELKPIHRRPAHAGKWPGMQLN